MSSDVTTTPVGTAPRLDAAAARTAVQVAVRPVHPQHPAVVVALDGDGLVLLADRTRQLAVGDPDGHSLLISCGAALCLTELALRAAGWQIETSCLPDPDDPDTLARMRPVGRTGADGQLAAQVASALRRRGDRRPFAEAQVAEQDRETLREASSDAAAYLDFPDTPDRHVELAVAVSWADRVERNDEAYLAEVNRWLRDLEVHATVDGIPVEAIPHVSTDAPRHTDVPLRDFEVGVTGGQLINHDVDESQMACVVARKRGEVNDLTNSRLGGPMCRTTPVGQDR